MFQYALGLSLTADRERTLRIDTTDVDADPKRCFELSECRPEPIRIGSLQRAAFKVARTTPLWGVIGGRRWPIYPGGPKLVLEREYSYDPSVFAVKGNIVLNGYWQSERYFLEHRGLVSRTFTWPQPTDSESLALLARIASSESVAVHVRRGDYALDATTNEYHGTCAPAYYAASASHFANTLGSPRFFVFSDDPAWAASSLALPGPWEVVRVNGPDSARRDMQLMSQCKHAIIANSSFSWWAAWLTERPGKMIVAPRQWFRDRRMRNITPVPSRWLQF